MKTGDRVYNITSNRAGRIIAGPMVPDSGSFEQVAEVAWDNARPSIVATRHLRLEPTPSAQVARAAFRGEISE